MTSRRVLVEQAVARGESFDWILTRLCDTTELDRVLARMDAVNGYRDDDEPVADSLYGPACPHVIAELIDALFPRTERLRCPMGRYVGTVQS